MSKLCLLYVYFVIWSKSSRPPQKKLLRPKNSPTSQASSEKLSTCLDFSLLHLSNSTLRRPRNHRFFFKRQTLGVNPQAALLAGAWKKLRVGGVWWVVCGGVWYVVV